jgi:hypothetical protein
MKRILLTLVLVCGILVSISPAAQAGIADCISLGYPSVSSSSTSIRMSVSMTVNCSKTQLGTGGGPLYSIESESTLTSSCSGPYSLYTGSSGTISCTINIGSSSGSSRIGSTSSTLKIWFAYDFSTKFVYFSHAAIPSKTSGTGSSGGSTGGSSGGSTGGTATLGCSSAPNKPVMIWLQLSDGIAFSATASSLGDRPTSLYYSYAYFDSVKNGWDTWSSWFSGSPTGTVSYKAVIGNNKTKIAFAVYAVNACGSSTQARESEDQKGLYLVPNLDPVVANAAAEMADAKAASTDAINAAKAAISNFSKERSKCVGSYAIMDSGTLTKYSSYCLKFDNEYSSLYQKIYAFNNSNFTTIDQANNGVDVANTYAEDADILVAKIKDVTSELEAAIYQASLPKKTTITCVKGKLTKKVTGINPKCPTGYKKK